MNKTNGKNNNSGYKGKYYDPNYKQNKAKYGDLYDPKDFAIPNPNYEPRQKSYKNNKPKYNASVKRPKRKSNYRGKNYDPLWHTYSKDKQKEIVAKRNKRRLNLILFLIFASVIAQVFTVVSSSTNIFDQFKIPQISTSVSQETPVTNTESTNTDNIIEPDINTLKSNSEIYIDSCDLSSSRQPNAKVNIGYGSRVYYGYTNEYSQLAYVQADSLQLQNSSTEDLTPDGRYCEAQANVDGVNESYNRGHAIGDALGGDSNAYNIFPQLSYINGGDYNDIERKLQETLYNGGSVTNFELKLTYPNSSTNIPSSYTMSYNLNGVYNEHIFNN